MSALTKVATVFKHKKTKTTEDLQRQKEKVEMAIEHNRQNPMFGAFEEESYIIASDFAEGNLNTGRIVDRKAYQTTNQNSEEQHIEVRPGVNYVIKSWEVNASQWIDG